MMKEKHLFKKVALGLILVSSPLRGFACGELGVPQNHFDGVNEQGNLSWWSQIDTLDLGQDFKVPLIIGFKSSRETVSPYLGKSWLLPLLESNIVQTDENNFLLTKPDGSTRRFYRAKITDTVLESTGGWKAEIKAQTINVWAECGWKFSYLLGKLTSLTTPKNQRLDLLYNGNRVTEVREGGGQTVLTVEVDPRTGRVSGLAFNGKKIGIEQDQKPRIEAIQGQNLIGGMDSALSKLTLADGSVKTFEYAPDEKLQPTMKISDLPVAAQQAKDGTPASSVEHRTSNVERILTWDAATKLVLKDVFPKGEWTYDIKPDENNSWANAAIGRTNEKREREFWLMDREHGRQIIQTLDGVKTEKVWFPSGLLARKMRRVEETRDGKTKLVEAWTYDEKGRTIRHLHENGEIESITYTAEGEAISSRDITRHEEAALKAQALLKKITEETDAENKERAIYDLAFIYIYGLGEPDKAIPLAKQISDPEKRFPILFHSYDQNKKLTNSEKISKFTSLLKEYPEREKFLVELIKSKNL